MAVFYPLGQDAFAKVKTWRGNVKINILRFKRPTNTKGGRLRSTGIKLDLIQFQRLVGLRTALTSDYDAQTVALPARDPPPPPPPQPPQMMPGGYMTQVPIPDTPLTSFQPIAYHDEFLASCAPEVTTAGDGMTAAGDADTLPLDDDLTPDGPMRVAKKAGIIKRRGRPSRSSNLIKKKKKTMQ
eukprot:TRINITY_DN24483_c1_g2_i1.p4 TRINITY_DN24483_c1_g2~~TRINITY_DN24483_c1_g2_i1.p4  ORF type:complete len:184 (+),score=24.99 TRINITY_DN24483_c1_g2_i1:4124-4675(+)